MNRATLPAIAMILTSCSDDGATATNAQDEAEPVSPPEQVVFSLYRQELESGARAMGSSDRLLNYRNVNCRLIRTYEKNPAPAWTCMLDVEWRQNGWHEKTNVKVTFYRGSWRIMPKDWRLF